MYIQEGFCHFKDGQMSGESDGILERPLTGRNPKTIDKVWQLMTEDC